MTPVVRPESHGRSLGRRRVTPVVRPQTPGPRKAPLARRHGSRHRSLRSDLSATAFSLGWLVRRACRVRLPAPYPLPKEDPVGRSSGSLRRSVSIGSSRYRIPGAAEKTCGFSGKTKPSRRWPGPARMSRVQVHGERRLPPLPPCGKMTVNQMGDGRPLADQPRTNRADEQSDGRERRMRCAVWLASMAAAALS